MALRQHSNEDMVEELTIALLEIPANGGVEAPTGTTRGEGRRRVVCSICHGLVEATACVQVSHSCEVHRPCALGYCEDTIPRARIFRAQIQPCTRSNKRWIYTPSSNRFELSAGQWTRRKTAPPETGSPLPSSVSWEGSI